MGNEIEALEKLLKKPTPQIMWTVTGFIIMFFFFGQSFLAHEIHFQIILSYGVGLSQLTINRFLTNWISKIQSSFIRKYELFSAFNSTITIFLLGLCYVLANIFELYDYDTPTKLITVVLIPFVLYLFQRRF